MNYYTNISSLYNQLKQALINYYLNSANTQKKKKKRITEEDIETLEKEFKLNTKWNKETVRRISNDIGFSSDKIYKWNWDKKRKMGN